MRIGKKTHSLLISIGLALAASSLYAEDKVENPQSGYTINYNTVSIIEYIKFASKICNTNFIFNEQDLNFTVTVVSEGPITAESVMSTLVQILRIHGLQLLEQENSLVIHKNQDVKQIATLFDEKGKGKPAPITTRIFRINNANPQSVASIVRPMISSEAMLEISPETRQLILTDVTANVNKVANLIENLDSPHTVLDIQSYTSQYNSTHYLIEIGSQLMQPIAQGNPFILVPADLAGNIYIVSTPELVAKAQVIFASLDVPPKKSVLASKKIKSENIFVYKLLYRPGDEVIHGLEKIADTLEKTGIPDTDLLETIDGATYIPATQSILFVGSSDSIDKIKEFLTALDVASNVAPPEKISFFVYKPVNRPAKEIESAILEMAKNLSGMKGSDPALLEAISSAKINAETNTITFSGEDSTFPKIKDLLSTIDTPSAKALKPAGKNTFYIYKINYGSSDDIENSLKSFAKTLSSSDVSEEGLIEAIQSAKYMKDSNSLLFTGNESAIKKLQELLPKFDVKPETLPPSSQFLIYKPKYQKGEQIVSSLRDLYDHLKSNEFADPGTLRALQSMKWVKSTNSILFTGDPDSLKKVDGLLASVDIPNPAAAKPELEKTFFVYRPTYASKDKTEAYLKQIADHLNKRTEEDLIETIRSAKWIDPSQSFMFQGTQPSITRLQELLKSFDTTAQQQQIAPQKSFTLIPLKNVSKESADQYLSQLAENLQKTGGDPALIEALQSRKWIGESKSFLFSADPSTVQKIEGILGKFDVSGPQQLPGSEKTFMIFQPLYASKDRTEAYVKQVADTLNKQTDPDLIEALRSAQWIESSRSFIFQGSQTSLNRVQDLLKNFDAAAQQSASPKGFFLFPLKNTDKDSTDQYLAQLADNLSKTGGDPDLIETLKSRKWIPESHSFMFNGSDSALAKIKDLLAAYDAQKGEKTPVAKQGYYIYKLTNTTGDVVEEDLDNLAKNFKSSGLKDAKILDVIDSIRYIKETNSLLLTGDPKAIEEVKELIAKYDYKRAESGPVSSNFYMYKPQNLPATAIEKSLREIANNLKKSDLADPALLSAINSIRYVDTTNSLIFTGTPEAIAKVQTLLKDIDLPPAKHAPIQHIGKTTFLLYKLKAASGQQISTSLKSIAADLKKSGTADKDFLAALNTMKFIPETDSLMFTGTEEALTKVQALVERFDVEGLAAPKEAPLPPPPAGFSNFFVYKPQSVSGPELEKLLQDFTENLKLTGLTDPDLFNTISTMRWVEKTQSLIFTGTPKSLDQVKTLLKDFDIPANLPNGEIPTANLEPSIQAIDNTSFLVYKLQFHKGDEIQSAMKQIAKDLILSNAPVNQNLLNSINSIQWLEVTNSLLCSGDQETLTRLRELIKNLDIPLKQVFIEMLVIQTSLTNALEFGLEWGGNYKYRNKFAGSMNNTIPPSNATASSTNDPLLETINSVTPSSGSTSLPPVPQPVNIQQVGNGFDLGIIGQIIKHNGNTYLNLSSLMSALQIDGEATVVMTPKLITQDGRTSTIFSGSNIPFAGSFVSQTGSNNTGTTNIEYRDIGLSLTLTPVLGNSDIVTLDITLDQSSVPSSAQNGQVTFNANGFPNSINGITSSKTTMQTTVHIPDNHFLILSGMVNNSNQKTKTGIPCLGGLPVVGAAFSQDNNTLNNTNVVIFIRPHILNSLDDMTRITKDQEEFFREQAGTPNLEHSYNEAMELIKTVDDE